MSARRRPKYLGATWDSDENLTGMFEFGRHLVSLELSSVAGRYEPVRVVVQNMRRDGPLLPVTGEIMRRLPIGEMARRTLAEVRVQVADAPKPKRSASGVGRPPMYDYEEVRRVYAEALGKKGHPTKAVMEHFGMGYSAAAKLVGRVRQAGILGDAPKAGVPGGVDATVVPETVTVKVTMPALTVTATSGAKNPTKRRKKGD